jgi:DMSO/TMAO reductase YedYZ molybdopterin-dependent catalytic subunit
MHTRRQFIRALVRLSAFFGGLTALCFSFVRTLFAQARRLLPEGTDPRGLFNENPAELDSRLLAVTPIGKFGTMGDTNIVQDLKAWRLEVVGDVRSPGTIDYDALRLRPAVESDVLLICPGVFSYNARWRGVSLWDILIDAGISPDVKRIDVHGKSVLFDKKESFSAEEIQNGKIFLAYAVNGRPLPLKHGFPLRIIADGHWGSQWVKYVYRIEAIGSMAPPLHPAADLPEMKD